MTRVGIDTGGTFTDAVTEDGRGAKVPSRTDDPSQAVSAAYRALLGETAGSLIHGSTVATNAALEGRLAPVGLLVNRGFRDLLHVGRQNRPQLYALEPEVAPLPVPSDLIAEVTGRLDAHGAEIEPLDVGDAVRSATRLVAEGAKVLAVVLLHAHTDPVHERRLLEALRDVGVPVVLSSAIDREAREVERGVVTVMNAGLLPVVASYLDRLIGRLPRGTKVTVMTSEGGALPAGEVSGEPVRLLLSGPAGGLVAASVYGAAAGSSELLTLDMGGTSTDVALLRDGTLPRAAGLESSGRFVRTPTLDIHTVGAGGGSVARADRGGALDVGPQSVGADPGPAAYGVGEIPCVTDAHLLLGHVPSDRFPASIPLDLDAAERALGRLARRLRMAPRSLARGILRVVEVRMLRALRVISLERGHDPRSDTLVAFGGAGGLHAVGLARALGVRRVLVPPDAGLLSARGLLWAPPLRTVVRSLPIGGVRSPRERRRLAAEAILDVRERLRSAGVARRDLLLSVAFDLRYSGQSYELEVPESADLERAFHDRHTRRFGFQDPDRGVEMTAVRVTGTARMDPPVLPRVAPSRRSAVSSGRSRSRFDAVQIPIFEFDELRAAQTFEGPAICVQRGGTVLLDRGARAVRHPTAGLMIEVAP